MKTILYITFIVIILFTGYMNVKIGTVSDIRTTPTTLHNALPAYFGKDTNKIWITKDNTLLPFIIMTVESFEYGGNAFVLLKVGPDTKTPK